MWHRPATSWLQQFSTLQVCYKLFSWKWRCNKICRRCLFVSRHHSTPEQSQLITIWERIFQVILTFNKFYESGGETSWNFKNFEALSWRIRFPFALFVLQRPDGHSNRGMNTRAVTSYNATKWEKWIRKTDLMYTFDLEKKRSHQIYLGNNINDKEKAH